MPWRALILLCTLLTLGCGHSVGDACNTNVDCSSIGDRFCDRSSTGGYCTIDGCDFNTCPGEAACIRFFTPIANQPCQFDKQPGQNGCSVSQRCLCDAPPVNGQCDAHCAPESTERRWCQKKCDNDADCRQGYQCRSTGTLGAEPVPQPTDGGSIQTAVKFCAPQGS